MDSPNLQLQCRDTTTNHLPVRDVAWVLRWATAMCIFAFAALVVTSFVSQLSSERALRQAAAAGLREAALPRATSESVEAAVRRHLNQRIRGWQAIRFQLDRGNVPVRGIIEAMNAEPLTLRLSATASGLAPRWSSFMGSQIEVAVRSGSTP